VLLLSLLLRRQMFPPRRLSLHRHFHPVLLALWMVRLQYPPQPEECDAVSTRVMLL